MAADGLLLCLSDLKLTGHLLEPTAMSDHTVVADVTPPGAVAGVVRIPVLTCPGSAQLLHRRIEAATISTHADLVDVVNPCLVGDLRRHLNHREPLSQSWATWCPHQWWGRHAEPESLQRGLTSRPFRTTYSGQSPGSRLQGHLARLPAYRRDERPPRCCGRVVNGPRRHASRRRLSRPNDQPSDSTACDSRLSRCLSCSESLPTGTRLRPGFS